MKLNLKEMEPSKLGFGCMRLPLREGSSDIDYEKAEAMIDYAYSRGVNYFDTAYPYHEQKSEAFIGRALKKYPRESFYLADKMPGWLVKNVQDAEKIFETQLERCQTGYFDFYLCHALSEENFKVYEEQGIYDFLKEKKAQGYIKNLGFSFHDTPDVLEYIVDKYEWDFAQLQINYLDWERQNAKKQYEILERAGLACIVMEPVRGGALAALCPEATEILEKACPGNSPASWALRFAASLPNVMTVLSGMSTEGQVIENVEIMTDFKPLTDDEARTLNRAKKVYLEVMTIPCTNCRYCSGCPEWIDIPKIFSMYNDYKISKNAASFKEKYEKLGMSNAASCVCCGHCMRHCPQGIKIPDRLAEINQLLKTL